MALIKCKECSKEISDTAQTCPNCGAPTAHASAPKEVTAGKKNRIGWIILLCIIASGAITVFFFISKGKMSLSETVFPPRPVVVSTDTSDVSTILDFAHMVKAVIRNDGGAGDVIVTFSYSDSGQTWTKTTRKYFQANETAELFMEFTEATLLGSDKTYNVEVR